jgi:hypothetical protein
MRVWARISSNSTIRFAAAILGASAAVLPCDAGEITRSAVDTGLPPYLVNRPACGVGEIFDEWPHCRRWPRARAQQFE